MTHLKIIQGNNQSDTEEVDMDIINKLYELASSGDLDAASELKGCLHLQVGERAKMEYLTNMFPNKLFITASNYIIPFEDKNMVTYLNSIGVGSNGVITEADAAAATIVANSANTTVTKFNELKYFTQITQSKGGWTGTNEGAIQFYNWTALEEVDISNFTSIGHRNGNAWKDTFRGCSALKKVIASNKLLNIGFGAFKGCQNLEEITGLSGNILLFEDAFSNCQKLKNSSFINCSFSFVDNNSRYAFQNCKLLTSITIASGETYIPQSTFNGCSALTTINIPSSITRIDNTAFQSCTSLTSVDLSNVTSIGDSAFRGTGLTSVDLSNTQLTEIPAACFRDCPNLGLVKLPTTCTIIRNSAFEGDSNLQISATDLARVNIIGNACFKGSGLSGEYSFPNLTTIEGSPFEGTKVTKLDFTGSVFTSIWAYFLNGQTYIQKLTFPDTLQTIQGSMLAGCTGLQYIKCLATTPPTAAGTIGAYIQNPTFKIYVPDASVNAYKAATYWSDNSARIFGLSQFATDFPNG